MNSQLALVVVVHGEGQLIKRRLEAHIEAGCTKHHSAVVQWVGYSRLVHDSSYDGTGLSNRKVGLLLMPYTHKRPLVLCGTYTDTYMAKQSHAVVRT